MISNILKASFVFVLAVTLSAATLAQVVTKKEVVVNPDGSYSVIEYPVGREVTVNLR